MKWIRPPRAYTPKSYVWQCSTCGKEVYYINGFTRYERATKECPYKYCPWCGEKMKEPEEDD